MRGKQGAKRRLQQAPCRLDDLRQSARELEPGKLFRREPFESVMLLVQLRLVGDPARRKRHDQIVAATARGRQHFAPASEAHNLDLQARLLTDLAVERG